MTTSLTLAFGVETIHSIAISVTYPSCQLLGRILEQRMGSSTAHPLEDAELDGFRGDVEMLAAPGSSSRAL